VTVTAEYLKEGLPAEAGGITLSAAAAHQAGRRLIESGTCLSCHQFDRRSIGPSYTAVAQRYRGDSTAVARLVSKIRSGGSGTWGNVTMPSHPQLTTDDATRMARYIVSLAEEQKPAPSLPVRGAYTPPDSATQGVVVLRAAYTDRGANGVPAASAEKTLALRAPMIVVASGEVADGVQKYKGPEVPVEVTIGSKSGAYVGFRQLDLTGVGAITFIATAPTPQLNSAGGSVEVRLDSATGPVIGTTEAIRPSPAMGPPTPLRATLAPTSGPRDVYFVFRNDSAPAGQSLFVLTVASFERAPATVPAR
jgi:cytochrome c